MTTLIFVHGTGVREDSYDASYEKVRKALAARCDFVRCYWGHLGAELHRGGVSIPDYDTARALEAADDFEPSDADYEVALWGVLTDDPLYELRILALHASAAPSTLGPGETTQGSELADLAEAFVVDAPLRLLLEQGGIEHDFAPARSALVRTDACRDALEPVEAGSLSDHRAAIARAFIAEAASRATRRTGSTPDIMLDAALRVRLEAAIVEATGGAERSIGSWTKAKLGRLVCRLATPVVERRRGAITDAAHPAAGDILLYQARGDAIRKFIRDTIADAPRPRVVLAHSLGGIACVDLLVRDPLPVDLLVTAGSQAPFLYEIGALHALSTGDELPQDFPPWLNIFDKRDFLSYVGARVFAGRVEDVEVDNRQPFPASHSAYWNNAAVWDAIAAALPRLPARR